MLPSFRIGAQKVRLVVGWGCRRIRIRVEVGGPITAYLPLEENKETVKKYRKAYRNKLFYLSNHLVYVRRCSANIVHVFKLIRYVMRSYVTLGMWRFRNYFKYQSDLCFIFCFTEIQTQNCTQPVLALIKYRLIDLLMTYR